MEGGMVIKSISQGGRANRNGKAAEDVIHSILVARGYKPERQKRLGISWGGGVIHADFYVEGLPSYPAGLVIESKWQQIVGSADDKFPGIWWDISHGQYRYPVMVIIAGGGARTGKVQWLKDRIDGVGLVAVFTLEELLSWFNRQHI